MQGKCQQDEDPQMYNLKTNSCLTHQTTLWHWWKWECDCKSEQ